MYLSNTARELSDEEKQMLMMTEEFHSFFDHSTRIIERALAEDTNIFADYSHDHEEDGEAYVFILYLENPRIIGPPILTDTSSKSFQAFLKILSIVCVRFYFISWESMSNYLQKF